MKKLIYYVLLLTSAYGCQSDSQTNENNSNGPVEIRLNAAVKKTRAAIDSNPIDGSFSADGMGIFMLAENVDEWQEGDQSTGLNNVGVSVRDGIISWNDGIARYYPSTTYQYGFYGYYPQGTATYASGKYTVEYTIDGTQDIFAGKSTQAVYNANYFRIDGNGELVPELRLEHKLTQLNFRITASADEGAAPATYFNVNGLRVQSVGITNVPVKALLTVADLNGDDGVLTAEEERGTVWVRKSDEEALVAAEHDLTVTGNVPETMSIGQGVMIPAMVQGNNCAVVITFQYGDDAANTVQRTIPLGGFSFSAGSSYTLNMTVGGSNQEVTLKAVLQPWTDGGTVNLGNISL